MPSLSCRCRIALLLVALLFLPGCAVTTPPKGGPAPATRPPAQERFFQTLDEVVSEYRVGEGSAFPIDGYPYLRTDRFLAAIKSDLRDDRQKLLWVEKMRELDLAAREKEISNLPDAGLEKLEAALGGFGGRDGLMEKVYSYSQQLASHDLREPGTFERLRSAVIVPGEYSSSMRILGLYPLAYVPVGVATENAYREYSRWHRRSPEELVVEGVMTAYAPSGIERVPPERIAEMFASAKRDAFGMPVLGDADREELVQAYAPVIHQDTAADYDRFGRVAWSDTAVTVDSADPVLYYYFTSNFAGGRPILQLNYSLWYTERSGAKTPWFEKGPLDGLTVRVSLDRQGQPFMVDVMNNCGCYFFYVPRKEKIERVRTSSAGLYPFVPVALPDTYPDRRLVLHINSGWHQVENIYSAKTISLQKTYRLLPYDVLEALPRKDGRGHFTDADVYDLNFTFRQ